MRGYLRAIRNFIAGTFLWVLLAPAVLIILGGVSNQLVCIVNHNTMPVLMSEARARTTGTVEINGLQYLDARHSLMTPNSHLVILADIFEHGEIESIGDLGIDLGQWLWGYAPAIWGVLVCFRLGGMATK